MIYGGVVLKKKVTSVIILLILIFIYIPCSYADSVSETTAAEALYTLGLFKGTGTNTDGTPIYDLQRPLTRNEAITMLVRLLGKEKEAQSGNWNIPFTDVDDWAKPYVGYAYDHKLTTGISSTRFGGSLPVTPSQYITFILRALGYSSDTDFEWDSAWILSDNLEITKGEYSNTTVFTRGDAAKVSYNSLKAKFKNSSDTLLSSLVSNGAVSIESVNAIGLSDVLNSASKVLTAEEIYSKCSPAVFIIEVFTAKSDYPNYPSASGSGFFISSDGIAITCYHVLKDTEFAIVTTLDGNKFSVTNVIFADEEQDIAVIRVNKKSLNDNSISNFSYLTMKDSTTVNNGSKCYTIGSPLGLQNSISDGIISNNSRVINNKRFIQTTVPISFGSSGGALINAYGEAVGVISAYYAGGQNLNLAIPLDSIIKLDLNTIGIPYSEYFYTKNKSNLDNRLTGANCYFKTDVRTFSDVTGQHCASTFIMGESKWYDGYVEGGWYTYEYKHEQQALDNLNTYIDYLTSSGFEELEYAKQIGSISKDYYINTKYSNGTETIIIRYTNYFKRIDVDPPYKKYGDKIINNNISYYSKFPRVPDAGIYFSIDLIDEGQLGDSYYYIYSSSGLPVSAPIVYSNILIENGFNYSYTNEYGESVYKSGFLHVYSYFSAEGYFVVAISN